MIDLIVEAPRLMIRQLSTSGELTLGLVAMLAVSPRVLSFMLPLLLGACSTQERLPPPNPAARAGIASYEASSPGSRPEGITKVLYNGKPAYLFTSPCCDRFNYLYDAQGQRLCAPSGGIAGRGDGKCTGTLTLEGLGPVRPAVQQ